MKKLFLLSILCVLFFIGCKDQNTPQEPAPQPPKDVIGLEKLVCNGKSILAKMNSKLYCDFGRVEKYSIELVAKPINAEIVDVSVTVDGAQAKGSVPNYTCYLLDGVNNIKIVLTSKKDPSTTKEYKIRVVKSTSNVPSTEGSKLKEIKVDGVDILSKFNKKYICELSDVEQTKNEISLFVLPHNSSATVTVVNGNETVEKTVANTYKVPIHYGQNNINVLVKSEKEGEIIYKIVIYREQELGLKSFKVEGIECCDENTGTLTKDILEFQLEKIKVSVVAKNTEATLTFKQNGKEIEANNGFYNLDLEKGKNGIEVVVSTKDGLRNKIYTIFFRKISPLSSGLIKLAADGYDLIHLLSSSNSITLLPRHNDASKLKLEVLATSNITIKVKLESDDISGTEGVYNIDLKEGNNNIIVGLYEGATPSESYSIFVKRYVKPEVPISPEADEVEVTFVLSDGVNGSAVDGSYINISKTQSSDTPKRILVKNGRAKTNLKKDSFYDFKVEGRNDAYDVKKYAASDVISYYIGNEAVVVPIVQRPMQRITKKAIAPIASSVKFGTEVLTAGNITNSDVMKKITMELTTVAHIEKLDLSTPLPMLGIGFVPSTEEDASSGVITANMDQDSTKSGDEWKSVCSWTSSASLINEKDVVIVVYDVASNRLEYHIRIRPSNAIADEDDALSITDMFLKFERLPTPSNIYSVGQDEGTKKSSHYKSNISFYAKKGGASVSLKGFDLYRKCVEDSSDYKLIKHVLYKTPKSQKHEVADTDAGLEDEKTYQYKVVAYTNDNKKSKLDKSDSLSIKVPKSASLLLEYPVDKAITVSEAKKLGYVFKFSNSKILKDAVEIRAGFLISSRAGQVLHGSKFRYVFDDGNGKPEIYFAKKEDAILSGNYYLGTNYTMKGSKLTNKSIEELISVDQEKGIIKIENDFFTLIQANLLGQNTVTYKKGVAYYWDIVDYGTEAGTDLDDRPCMIIHKPSSNVIIISSVNDRLNGNNAWNGRAEFSLRAE